VRADFLDWSNIQADDLPACDYCRSLRRVRGDYPVRHPNFGQMERCPVCGPLVVRRRMQATYREKTDRINQYTCLEGRAEEQTFGNFSLRRDEGKNTNSVRIAFAQAKMFAADPTNFLVLHGTRGVGKSHLVAAIANKLRDSDEDFPPIPLIFVVPELLELLRSGYDNGDYQEMLGLCKNVDVLILDDLGTESETGWAFEKLFQIINYRYQRQLPTVIVTNCDLNELEPRLHSRLASDENMVVEVEASDYRQLEREPGLVL